MTPKTERKKQVRVFAIFSTGGEQAIRLKFTTTTNAFTPSELRRCNKGFDLMHAGESIRSVVVF